MAISRLSAQDTTNTSSATTVSATYAGATTANNLLIAVVWSNGTVTPTITVGGTWSTLVNGTGYGSNGKCTIFYKLALGSETTITGSGSGATLMSIAIFEYTGNANPIVLDGIATAKNNGISGVTTYTTPNITTVHANDLIFSVMFEGGTAFSWTSSSLIGQTTNSGVVMNSGQYIVSSAQSNFQDTGSWTTSTETSSMVGAFQASPGKTPTTWNNFQFPSVLDNGNAVMSVTEKIR
jgi:hypothetical protein